MSGRDHLNVGEVFLQALDELLLLDRVQMAVDLVAQEDGMAALGRTVELAEPLDPSVQSTPGWKSCPG